MIEQIGHKSGQTGQNLVETGSVNPMPVKPSASSDDWAYASAGAIVNTSPVFLKFGSAGQIVYLTALQLKNTNATPTEIQVKSGANILFRTYVTGSMSNSDVITFPTPLKTVAGDSLSLVCITTGASLYVNAQGYALT